MQSNRKKLIVIALLVVTFLLGVLSVAISYYIQQSQSPNDSSADAQCATFGDNSVGAECRCMSQNGSTKLDGNNYYRCSVQQFTNPDATIYYTADWQLVGCNNNGTGLLFADSVTVPNSCGTQNGAGCPIGQSRKIRCIAAEPSLTQESCEPDSACPTYNLDVCPTDRSCSTSQITGFNLICSKSNVPNYCCPSGYINQNGECKITSAGNCSIDSDVPCDKLNLGDSCSGTGRCIVAGSGNGSDGKFNCTCYIEDSQTPNNNASNGQKTALTTFSQVCNDADGCTCPSGSTTTTVNSGSSCTQTGSQPVVGGSCGGGGSCFLQGGVYSGVTVNNCGSVGRIDSSPNNCSSGYLCCKVNSYIAQCTWNSNSPAGCTGDGVNRQYINGTPTRAACCSGLTEDGYGTCGCTQAPALVLSCTNGATNYPDCNSCPSGQTYVNGNCQSVCTNGATNYPTCNTCLSGYTIVNGVCTAPCTNGAVNAGACTTCPSNYTMVNNQCTANCTNGATNPGSCNTCPSGKSLIGGSCIVPTIIPTTSGIGGGALPSTGLLDSNYSKVFLGIMFMLVGVILYKYNIYNYSLEFLAWIEKSMNSNVKNKAKKTLKSKPGIDKFEEAVEKKFENK